MLTKLKKNLGCPLPPAEEKPFKTGFVLQMYKPLLLVVSFLFLFLAMLLAYCFFAPQWVAPEPYIPTLTAIHMGFFVFTAVVLCLAALLRRRFVVHPGLYFAVCNGYGVGVLAWASCLAAYASFSSVIFTAIVYVSLGVALVTLLKPWQALLLFGGNYLFFLFLLVAVWPSSQPIWAQLTNAGLAAGLSVVISAVFYRFRVRIYHDHTTISAQMEEIHRINSRLQALIHLDQLTGIHNRRYFEEVLPKELEALSKAGRPACGMMVDVDFFKAYNDRYGHQAGDICLRRIAGILCAEVPQQHARVIRYGGEEFFVLAATQNKEQALALAQRLCDAVEQEYIEHLSHPGGKVTVSVGVALLSAADAADGPKALSALTKAADAALYSAKEQGRNRVVLCASEGGGEGTSTPPQQEEAG
ncbi:diguanylate cyclase [Ruminococcaceae bacterium OttesenSCG-928-I18]|nr:diguanylate cyclase [Ruminococcaceae bacterium OttesenSCG-928-I18]